MIKYLIAIIFLIPSVSFGATLELNEGASIDTENFGVGANKGQSFTHSVDYDIENIEIWGGLGNSAGTTIGVNIYEGAGSGGTIVCSVTGVDVTGWPSWSSADWQTIAISCPDLTGGDIYTFEIIAEDGSSSDAIRWATSDQSYAGGQEYFAGSARSSRDTMFRILGTEIGGGGGETGTTTTATTTIVVNPSQDYFNAILLFYLCAFFMLHLLRRNR